MENDCPMKDPMNTIEMVAFRLVSSVDEKTTLCPILACNDSPFSVIRHLRSLIFYIRILYQQDYISASI